MTIPPSGDRVPTRSELLNPTLRAIRSLGGSASIEEITKQVVRDLSLPAAVTEVAHGEDSKTELEYQLGWARTYLKRYGAIDNSQRGVWTLTEPGQRMAEVVPSDIGEWVNRQSPKRDMPQVFVGVGHESDELSEVDQDWKTELLKVLRQMKPDAFERLCQRVLRESGFVEVNVTGKSGDGGIDGIGKIRFADLISFPVVFQCKRWNSIVAPSVVRDFRGAMAGRADRGIIITTSAFTRDAYQEASRDGVPPIDLIDGEKLVNKVKALGLGVKTEMVEQVTIESAWFHQI